MDRRKEYQEVFERLFEKMAEQIGDNN